MRLLHLPVPTPSGTKTQKKNVVVAHDVTDLVLVAYLQLRCQADSSTIYHEVLCIFVYTQREIRFVRSSFVPLGESWLHRGLSWHGQPR